MSSYYTINPNLSKFEEIIKQLNCKIEGTLSSIKSTLGSGLSAHLHTDSQAIGFYLYVTLFCF